MGPGAAGMEFTIIFTSSVEVGHVPLLTVHLKVFVPEPKVLRGEFGSGPFKIVPEPLTSDQVPKPVVGVVAPKVVAVVQSD
jgi:hypothetical protein